MVERKLRLRREAEVKRTRAKGRAWADGPLVARVLPNGLEPPQNRYAVIAGKQVGKAHERNRAKRLVREAIRALHPRLRPGHDVAPILSKPVLGNSVLSKSVLSKSVLSKSDSSRFRQQDTSHVRHSRYRRP